MASVGEILSFLWKAAPPELAEGFDNVGLIAGDEEVNVTRALLALDITEDVIAEAVEQKAQLIISHHPVVFGNVKRFTPQDYVAKRAYSLVRAGISAICMHTNLDAADDGVGETLAKKIGLTDIREIEGTGENGNCGRIGFLEEPVEPEWLALKVKDELGCEAVRYVSGGRKVSAVAVIGGSGGDFAELVANSGADAFVTADVKHHQFIYAKDSGLTLIDAGHYETEYPIIPELKKRLEEEFTMVKFTLSESGSVINTLY
ncbi:MAG: Nif3-like dinuclear metal center hexameric protein [Clostridia bacterium]|nr:Nif3-like dinuclear metal center hexameric protein [Clostridia bacterium]MBR5942253.1 Nif3-like dinuclear metal center hexameric protein [Clostridia bacterium]